MGWLQGKKRAGKRERGASESTKVDKGCHRLVTAQEEGKGIRGGEGRGGYVPASHICYSFVPSWEENSRKRSGGGGR